MFLCAVCDTSVPMEDTFPPRIRPTISMTHVMSFKAPPGPGAARQMGRFALQEESDQVRHVGDAVVIFDERCVTPIFTLTSKPVKPSPEASTMTFRHHVPLVCNDDFEEAEWESPHQIGKRRFVMPEDGMDLVRAGAPHQRSG
eukprot:CAMPEP_0197942304 /NCGR_PEP_ID=MMETSP1439-20131203/124149_1 /TAXON_ID=66791 /ORGANISM="Gonyaulax spinifera, Strain CCMP409" /LENGTH=142 /DNA_ID=CAMNT_0043565553 /DNA_START=11 /DNA_END=435 /DNA_ORIENTATION=-